MTTIALTRPAADLRFHPLRDSATMLRRNLKRMLRYPSMTLMLVGMPVIFLLLFVYVLGGTEQPAHAAGAAALPRQRVRTHRLDAGRPALVRRVPAVHPDHRNRPGPADEPADREQRVDRAGLVRRHRPGWVPLVEAPVQ